MMTPKKPILIISGPTASGKTDLAIALARHFAPKQELVVVNFDSLLFYRELNIGTAKPSPQERESIPHQGIDIVSIRDQFNANDFLTIAEAAIEELHQVGKVPLLVGGSGFYLRALIKGMSPGKTTPTAIREQVETIFQTEGIVGVRERLQRDDPESFKKLHENDHYRNLRALEHFLSTGTKMSAALDEIKNPYDFSESTHPDWECHHIYLDLPKPQHWEVIEKRTHQMIAAGLENEVRSLLVAGFSPELKALGSIGYKETIDYISGKFADDSAWALRISLSTRQLAKSQRTFFKKITPKHCYHPLLDRAQIITDVAAFLCKWQAP